MYDAIYSFGGFFADGVDAFFRVDSGFFGARNNLTTNGVVRVFCLN